MSRYYNDYLQHSDEDTLAHFGTPGMKWGVRKQTEGSKNPISWMINKHKERKELRARLKDQATRHNLKIHDRFYANAKGLKKVVSYFDKRKAIKYGKYGLEYEDPKNGIRTLSLSKFGGNLHISVNPSMKRQRAIREREELYLKGIGKTKTGNPKKSSYRRTAASTGIQIAKETALLAAGGYAMRKAIKYAQTHDVAAKVSDIMRKFNKNIIDASYTVRPAQTLLPSPLALLPMPK